MPAADGNEALAQLVSILNRHDIAYMLVGSYSSNAYGIPRATGDADLVVATLDAAFDLIGSSLGNNFIIAPQIESELLTGTFRRVIRFAPINFALELFQLSDDAFDQSRFRRRLQVQSAVLGGAVWLPTAEDVIIQKLRWGRAQDLLDAENVMVVQGERLDWHYIRHWTDQHGSTIALDKIQGDL